MVVHVFGVWPEEIMAEEGVFEVSRDTFDQERGV